MRSTIRASLSTILRAHYLHSDKSNARTMKFPLLCCFHCCSRFAYIQSKQVNIACKEAQSDIENKIQVS